MNGKKAKHLRRLFQTHIRNKGRAEGITEWEKIELDPGSWRRFKANIQRMSHPLQVKIGI
mgnify:CR=1 FL=1